MPINQLNIWDYLFVIGIYVFCILVCHFPIRFVMNQGWTKVYEQYTYYPNTQKRDDWLPSIVGGFDRLLYLTTILIGHPEFVAIWLTLKTFGKPRNWSEDIGGIPSRAIYNLFIIGNALCIMVSLTSALSIYYFTGFENGTIKIQENKFVAILIPILCAGIICLIGLYIYKIKVDKLPNPYRFNIKLPKKYKQ
jgi:hypothetical protein